MQLLSREEFLQARCGSIGASDVPRVVRRTKTGVSADRSNLLALKVIERLTGRPVETYQTAAMLNGIEREPEALAAYALMTNVEVEPVDPIPHPEIPGTHASPDGLVGERGLVEVKCPQPATHLATLITEQVEADYLTQIQWQLACTGRDWCDFVSYCPAFPPAMQLFIRRVPRSQERILELEADVTLFLIELDQKVDWLRERYGIEKAA